jgi:transposase
MEMKRALALPVGLDVRGIEMTNDGVSITVVSTQMYPCCPLCGGSAERVHSHYIRQLADLPCGGQCIRLLIQVRKYFCDVTTCARKIFAERLTPFIEPRARVTKRLYQIVQGIGLATGGMLGARLATRLGIQTSWMTILRRVMALPTVPVEHVSELGIDDFSFRRGRKFGSILVDMQSHQVIDLLPDRKAETAKVWMKAHPEITLVSRDRGGDYAAGAREGAPQAIQCADRFHLLKNLGEALEGLLAHHLAAQWTRQTQTTMSEGTPSGWRPKRAIRSSPKLEYLQQARREERLAHYEQVIALYKLGMSQVAIAQQVGIGASTVQSWLAAGRFPERKPREQGSHVDHYLPYLIIRWEDGCHNIAGLFRELVEQGYQGSYESVRDTLVRLLPTGRKKATDIVLKTPPLATSRQAAFLFLRRLDDLKVEEQETLVRLRQMHPHVDLAYALVQQFALMLRTRTGEQLNAWLEKARASQIRELQGFVLGVERDKAAVVAGLTLPQNNGLVEGHVNKLKLIKRMGYGRAGFPLLRQRVLHAL